MFFAPADRPGGSRGEKHVVAWRLFAAAFLAIVSTSASTGPASPGPGQEPALGVAVHSTDPALVPSLARTGVQVVRTDLVWWRVVRPQGLGLDWTEYDAFVGALRAHRLLPLLILRYEHHGVPAPPRTVLQLEEFSAFAEAAAARYPGCVWEVWNEPNLDRFWPSPDPVAYVWMLADVSRAIHRADPSAVVIGGNVGGADFDLDYVRGAIAAGLLDHADAVSVHPYGAAQPEDAIAFYQAIRRLMPRGRERPLVVSEWGYSSAGLGEDGQADYLARSLRTNDASDIGLTVWYCWQDEGDDAKDPEDRFGLLRLDGTPKPAYRELVRAQ